MKKIVFTFFGCSTAKSLLLLLLFFFTHGASELIAQYNEWTWIKGDNTSGVMGIYGTKGIEASTNKPGSREGSVSWTDAAGNFWMLGGTGYGQLNAGSLNDLWKYNPSTNNWSWVNGDNSPNHFGIYGVQGTPAAANQPGSRNAAASWTDAAGNFWLFGGSGYAESNSGSLNDLWKYNPSNGQWTWMKGEKNPVINYGVYGMQGVAAPGNNPGARTGGMTWTDAAGNLWLYGGLGFAESAYGGLTDLWKYNTSTNEWSWMKGPKTVYTPGVYGTMGVASAANFPGIRNGGFTWTDQTGALWLFGGNGSSAAGVGDLNMLWKYNTATNIWTWVRGDNMADAPGNFGTIGVASNLNNPRGRIDGVRWNDTYGNLWLFGGMINSLGSKSLNDLWKYNISSGQWTWISGDNSLSPIAVYGVKGTSSPANKPGGRMIDVAWTNASGNLYLFGGKGFSANGTTQMNDLWRYVPVPPAPAITSFTPALAITGNTVTITGANFTGATTVMFGNTSATSFSVVNNGTIAAIVGLGSTGSVSVTTPGGIATKSGFTYCTPSTSDTTVSACNSYYWNGISYNVSGNYTYHTTNAGGCDSAANLHLTINHSSITNLTATACDSYTWNDAIYTSSGTYTFLTTTAGGCDSLVNLTLIIRHSTSSIQAVKTCYTYTWNGNVYTTSGIYNYTTTNAGGCDSVATLNLTISPVTATVSSTNLKCYKSADGSISVTASGGAGGYNYKLGLLGVNQPTGIFTGLAAGTYKVYITDSIGCTGSTGNIVITQPAAPTATTSNVNATCYGSMNGSITVTSTTGIAPFQYKNGTTGIYQSGPAFNMLKAGSYRIYILDSAGCTGSTSLIAITQPPAIVGAYTSTAATCFGASNGSATITSATGPSPFTYSIDANSITQASPTFTGLKAGVHKIYIYAANGCTGVVSVTIAQGPMLTGSFTTSNATCYGTSTGTITVTPLTGTAPFMYQLSTSNIYQSPNVFGGIKAGSYKVNIYDSLGCSGATNTITITQPAALAGAYTTTPASCAAKANGSITFTPTNGVAPYQYKTNLVGAVYQSSNTFTGLKSGKYTISVQDAVGCVAYFPVTIPMAPANVVTYTATGAGCERPAGTITLTATGRAPFLYKLSTQAVYNVSNTFSSLAAGTYTANIKDSAGCVASLTPIVVAPCVPSGRQGEIVKSESENSNHYIIFPNPSTNEFKLQLSDKTNEEVSINVFDTDGRNVYHVTRASNQTYTFGNNFATGLYFVEIRKGKEVKTLKAIKNK